MTFAPAPATGWRAAFPPARWLPPTRARSCPLGSALLAGCVVYQPVTVPGPANFDRAWSAGVQVTSSDPSTGLIRGTKDGIDVTVVVARQADGSVRVQFDAKGPTQRDPGLSNRFSQAYERRMGR